MSELKIWYRVNNQGDGSVAVRFCESRELADFLEDEEQNYGEGWGESSVDHITVCGENLFAVGLKTVAEEYVERVLDTTRSYAGRKERKDAARLAAHFYSKTGAPTFTVEPQLNSKCYYNIRLDGKLIHIHFSTDGDPSVEKAEEIQRALNSFTWEAPGEDDRDEEDEEDEDY